MYRLYNALPISMLILLLTFVFTASIYSLDVLVLGGNVEGENWDLQALQKYPEVAGEAITCATTKDVSLPDLNNIDFDVLWIGQGEIQENNYRLNAEGEDKIKSFVLSGGVVVVANQDSDGGNPCGIGWLPEDVSLVGVEASDHDFTPTAEAGDLFSAPNNINTNAINLDDSWSQPDDAFIVLATSGGNTPFVMLEVGGGMYLVTDMETHNAGEVTSNGPMHENILHFIITWLGENVSVEPGGAIATTWGEVKY